VVISKKMSNSWGALVRHEVAVGVGVGTSPWMWGFAVEDMDNIVSKKTQTHILHGAGIFTYKTG
jgi:hypothetical protein